MNNNEILLSIIRKTLETYAYFLNLSKSYSSDIVDKINKKELITFELVVSYLERYKEFIRELRYIIDIISKNYKNVKDNIIRSYISSYGNVDGTLLNFFDILEKLIKNNKKIECYKIGEKGFFSKKYVIKKEKMSKPECLKEIESLLSKLLGLFLELNEKYGVIVKLLERMDNPKIKEKFNFINNLLYTNVIRLVTALRPDLVVESNVSMIINEMNKILVTVQKLLSSVNQSFEKYSKSKSRNTGREQLSIDYYNRFFTNSYYYHDLLSKDKSKHLEINVKNPRILSNNSCDISEHKWEISNGKTTDSNIKIELGREGDGKTKPEGEMKKTENKSVIYVFIRQKGYIKVQKNDFSENFLGSDISSIYLTEKKDKSISLLNYLRNMFLNYQNYQIKGITGVNSSNLKDILNEIFIKYKIHFCNNNELYKKLFEEKCKFIDSLKIIPEENKNITYFLLILLFEKEEGYYLRFLIGVAVRTENGDCKDIRETLEKDKNISEAFNSLIDKIIKNLEMKDYKIEKVLY